MSNGQNTLAARDLAAYIDHTLLAADATPDQIISLCTDARTHAFKAVCVNPIYVPLVVRELAGTDVLTCSVVCFPFGADPASAKVSETRWAVEQGAREIDMVIALGLLKSGDTDGVRADIAAVKDACGDAVLKVIIETALLTDEQKVLACELSKQAGADFVKTSTGFAGGGATVEDIALMRKTVGPDLGVKASGGVRTTEDALKMIAAGASRIGASASIKIIGQ
ncbi:deoxyribose-phosphate aldolase [Thalassospira mesophila]|uniref:Deoxyribose-phosphate aldolase n=1 Tax=Thalassospira mesophila TaxID=1293891 RepID=A0A1Y2KVS2_9PROT|nr:deoxyribose-phosphate aldolase [Thalassospira mesophila]OSQ35983.1 deoxyribose-phosphate aldolase [Thalassospira mesophila]